MDGTAARLRCAYSVIAPLHLVKTAWALHALIAFGIGLRGAGETPGSNINATAEDEEAEQQEDDQNSS